MAGHSKWHNIKHKKAKEDAKKGKVFTKLSKEITICAKAFGGDPAGNARLRLILDRARDSNMPKDIIERAIKKGTGQLEGASYESILYEGYAPHNVAVLVHALTDNKNRTASDVRHVFSKGNARVADLGAVSWMFEQKGQIEFDTKGKSEDELLSELLEVEIDDLHVEESSGVIICPMDQLDTVRSFLEQKGFTVKTAEIAWVAKNKISIADDAQRQAVFDFLDKLEELDDVQDIYINLE